MFHKEKISFFLLFTIALFLIFGERAHATTTSGVFRSHLKGIFIETGSFIGDGIQQALDAGFQEVHSIELFPQFYELCSERFAGDPRVHMHLGDSADMLKVVLAGIQEPVTFWLDGHYSGEGTAMGKNSTPIFAELAAIAEHPIKTHTILIDDVRLFGEKEFDYISKKDVIKMIRSINPHYVIYYEDGYCKNDVLVAEIR